MTLTTMDREAYVMESTVQATQVTAGMVSAAATTVPLRVTAQAPFTIRSAHLCSATFWLGFGSAAAGTHADATAVSARSDDTLAAVLCSRMNR